MERRLTTILSADVAGYGRLMEVDETGALDTLKSNTANIVDPLTEKFGARIVKHLGDGFLAEFPSVVNAVQFAAELQNGMVTRNTSLPEDKRMRFRIGINLSDVIADGGDIYGDGVNMAVRLQSLAEAGGICISDTVYQHVRRHTSYQFEDVGERRLKHVALPQRVYRLVVSRPDTSRRQAGDYQASIAVLPFTNLSGDPEQDYFGDGIAEDIITDLSKVSALFVVARNTSFTLKGKAVEIDQVARKLDVKYVLEGSVRKAGPRVRITAQLIDGETNGHVWAERYDRDFEDILAIQDELSNAIVNALKVKLLPAEKAGFAKRPTESTDAYRYYLMARSIYHKGGLTRRSLRIARQMFHKAVEFDPLFARAHAGIADCNSLLLDSGDTSVSFEDVLARSERALSLDEGLAEAHSAKGLALYTNGKYREADACFRTAIGLDPNLFEAYFFYGRNSMNQDRYEEAANLFTRAAELKPDDFRSLGLIAMCYMSLGLEADAHAANRRALARVEAAVMQRPDDADALGFGAGVLAMIGERARALDWADRALVIEPEDYDLRYNLACAFAIMGESDKAAELLDEAMAGIGYKSRVEYMMHDRDLDSIRTHPRYLDMIERLKFGRSG
jgi:adenylate cyclase